MSAIDPACSMPDTIAHVGITGDFDGGKPILIPQTLANGLGDALLTQRIKRRDLSQSRQLHAETISDREERHSVIVRHAAQGAAHGSLLNVGRFQEVGPESGCLTLEFAL